LGKRHYKKFWWRTTTRLLYPKPERTMCTFRVNFSKEIWNLKVRHLAGQTKLYHFMHCVQNDTKYESNYFTSQTMGWKDTILYLGYFLLRLLYLVKQSIGYGLQSSSVWIQDELVTRWKHWENLIDIVFILHLFFWLHISYFDIYSQHVLMCHSYLLRFHKFKFNFFWLQTLNLDHVISGTDWLTYALQLNPWFIFFQVSVKLKFSFSGYQFLCDLTRSGLFYLTNMTVTLVYFF
jgi:hypothetical protein